MGETSSKPAERIRNVFVQGGRNRILSPPISHVLAMKGCPEVIDNLNNCLKYKKLKAIEHIGNMLSNLGLDNITRAFKKAVDCCDTLQSPRDVLFPPISQVLNRNGCPHLMDYLNNCLKHKNTKAIEHTGTCLLAIWEIKFIDELCYCPEDSDEKCHHGTSCCDNRKIKALTSVH
ncbi:hypothetical protein GPALN_014483 [Globodera pallida]|nr:hypothetical protein GPALN_014483 [Globodera pallida]